MTERDVNGTTLTPLNMLYSGPYSITSVTNDETTDIKMVTLNRNPKYIDNEYHIEKINFRFFREPNHLIKYKSLINVFNDTQNIL
jgi:ABC-type oligopeptide transport system substrate-binding subunit